MAKGPGGKEVDRVSVRVVPDTSKFAQELRAYLKKLEETLRVKVDVEFDTSQIKAAAARIRKELGAPVKVRVEADVKATKKLAESIPNSLPRIDMSRFNVTLGRTETLIGNVVAHSMQLSRFLARIRQRSAEVARETLNLAKRTANLRAHWRAVGAKLTQAAKSIRHVNADGFYRNMIRTSDAILGASSRMGRFGLVAARSLGRITTGAAKGAVSAISGIGSAAGRALGSLSKLTRAGWIAVAVFTLAAPAVGLVATLLAGLPSLALAAAAGIAAVALGMDGIKAAASQLGPEVDALKASLSANFEAGLRPVFAQLEKVFPVLDRGLNKVADGVIVMADSFVDVVTSAKGMAQLDAILANTGRFFEQLAPMVRDGTSAFLSLAKAGSDQFGTLAGVLNGFAAEFRSMTERIIADGSFASGIEGLAAVTSSLLSLFVKLFEAGVRVMGDIGGPLAAFIDSFGDALVALMPALGTITNLFATVLTAALDAIVPAIQALTPAFQLLASIVGQLLTGAIAALVPILTVLAEIIADVLLSVLEAIQPVIKPLIGFLTELGRIVADFLTDAFRVLEPFIAELVTLLADLLAELLPLLPTLLDLAKVIFTAVLDVLVQLMPALMQLAQIVFPILVQIVKTAVPIIAQIAEVFAEILVPLVQLIGFIIEAVMPVFTALLELIQNIWPQIEGIIRGVLDVIVGIIKFVLGVITGDWDTAWEGIKLIFSGAWQAIKDGLVLAVKGLVELFWNLPGALLAAIGDLGGLLFDAGVSIISGLIDGIKSMFSTALNWVGDLVGQIRDFFPFSPAKTGPFSGRGHTLHSGRALVTDWAKGITDGTPAAIGAVEDMMRATNSAASAEWNGEISSQGFGGIGSVIGDALSQWEVRLDGSGLAKLVNTANIRKARRG